MKRWVRWLAASVFLAGVGVWIYGHYFSAPAQIKAAGSAFMRAAVSGDEAVIQHALAPDSPMTATDIVQLYKGHTFNNFNVYPNKALPNGSGVAWMAITSTLDMTNPRSGYTRGTTLAFKRGDGRWLIYKVGASFSL